MARLSEHGLRRSVGTSGLFATAYGNVGSSIYYALGLVAAHALGLTPLVFVFAGGLFALTAKTYAEGASMFPEAGGSSSFARHAFNELISFFAGWALSLDYILTIAISAFFVPHYLSTFPGLSGLNHNPGDIFGGLIVVVALAALNIRGLGESAKLNFILAIVDLSTQVLLVAIGAVLVLDPSLLIHQIHLGKVPTWHELIFALSLAMLAYTGIETVSNMAEEARDPGKQVPKAVNLVVLAVLGVYLGISLIALSALPVTAVPGHPHQFQTLLGVEGNGGFQNDPVLGIVSRLGLHGTVLTLAQYYVGLLAATILFIATNAGMIGISRLSWSLAEHRQLPGIFSQLHPRFRTPWFTIVFFSGLAGLLVLYGNTNVLGNLYSFGALLSFTVAHISVIALRVKKPDQERPYRMPWNVRIRGASIPMTAVIGGIGTATVWIVVVVTHPEARLVGIPWMVFGMVGYVIYETLSQGLGPARDLPHRARGASGRFPGARLPHRLGADLRRRRQRERPVERSQADRRRGCRVCGVRVAGAFPVVSGGGLGSRGGTGPLGLGDGPHQGEALQHQDPHRPDPYPQPRRCARGRGQARGSRRHLLVHDPCTRGRAADRADRHLSTCEASLSSDHRDREPARASSRWVTGRL